MVALVQLADRAFSICLYAYFLTCFVCAFYINVTSSFYIIFTCIDGNPKQPFYSQHLFFKYREHK